MSGISGVSPQDYQARLLAQQGFQSRYIPGSMVGGADLFQSQPVHPVQHAPERPGFFSKLGATLRGVAGTLPAIGRAITNPKNLLIGAATIGACFIPGVGPFIAAGLIAYGVGSSAVGIAKGVGNTVQGWYNGDLQQIEQGGTQLGVSTLTGAASVFGARAFMRAQFNTNPTAMAARGEQAVTVGNRTITEAGQIGYADAVRLMPRYLGNGARGAYGDARAFIRDGSSWSNKFDYLRESAQLRLAGTLDNTRAFRTNVDVQTALRNKEMAPFRPTGGAQPTNLGDTVRNVQGRVQDSARNAYDFVVRDRSSLANKAEYLGESARLRWQAARQNFPGQANEFARRLNDTRLADYAYTYNRDFPGVLPGIAGAADAS